MALSILVVAGIFVVLVCLFSGTDPDTTAEIAGREEIRNLNSK